LASMNRPLATVLIALFDTDITAAVFAPERQQMLRKSGNRERQNQGSKINSWDGEVAVRALIDGVERPVAEPGRRWKSAEAKRDRHALVSRAKRYTRSHRGHSAVCPPRGNAATTRAGGQRGCGDPEAGRMIRNEHTEDYAVIADDVVAKHKLEAVRCG
jgi:hypothetical protein